MLTYKKEFVCNNTVVTAIVGEDGSLTMEGFDEEYEDTLVALGGARSICQKLVDEWEASRSTALTAYLADDIRAVVSTAADAVEQASLVYSSKRFTKKPEDTVARAISNTRKIVNVRTDQPRRTWLALSPSEETTKSDELILFETEIELSHYYSPKSESIKSLRALYDSAGFLCRSIGKINLVDANLVSDLESPKNIEDGWWSYVAQNAGLAINHAAWSIAFISGWPHHASFKTAIDWIIGRFVLGMNSLETGRKWPALEPL